MIDTRMLHLCSKIIYPSLDLKKEFCNETSRDNQVNGPLYNSLLSRYHFENY